MTSIRFCAVLEPQPEGGYTVTFPDFPEAITEADDREHALSNAAEVLTLCLEQRLEDGDPIPGAVRSEGGVWIEPSEAVQAALRVRERKAANA
jgi:antitoxin HicB